jgi:peroxiredoxin
MKIRLPVFLVFLAILFSAGSALAADPKPKNYLVCAIKTDLQRTLLFSTKAAVYLQLDVAECLDHGKFDPQRLDGEGLRRELATLAKQSGVANPRLQIAYRYAGVDMNSKESKALEEAVKAIGRQAGFVKFGTISMGEGGSWLEKVASFAKVTDDPNPTESPVVNDFVRAYPVRTRLSRLLLGAESDCYIELRQPIDGRFKEFSPELRRAIGQGVAELNLQHKRKLAFQCTVTENGQEPLWRYFGQEARSWHPERSAAAAFVKEIGFRSCGTGMIPMGVFPEKLLGKPAPDFTLDALAGGKIHLQEMIRGRVAVIAFWGVACGACCEEAPHLTALYKEYKDHGLAVIAVDGYNESKKVVDRFVRAKGILHPIAMMGGKVAAEKYTVASYPVTYLVDRTGLIVDYHLGFDPGDEKLLAKAITRLLAEHESAKAKE